jgi:two-component system chemotaxis response regulator CheB
MAGRGKEAQGRGPQGKLPGGVRRKWRVLVVDDSAFFRQSIAEMLNNSGRFEVVGRAADGVDAMALMRSAMPDLVTLDLEMPRMNGFAFLRWVMSTHPVPVLVFSSHDSHASVFHAMELGAADFMAKPSPRASLEILSLKQELCDKLEQISAVGLKAIAHRSRLLATPVQPGSAQPFGGNSSVRLVVIGASTGGPPAVQAILRELPPTFPSPIVIAQHMPPVFTRHFAERLNTQCPLTVCEARDGDTIEPGKILVVPGNSHLAFEGRIPRLHARLLPKREADRYSPSIDLTMEAAANLLQDGVVGILLTGMGDDGKAGMLAIKARGGHTIAESEETAEIFGMPREAIHAGAVNQVLPLPSIAAALMALTRSSFSS